MHHLVRRWALLFASVLFVVVVAGPLPADALIPTQAPAQAPVAATTAHGHTADLSHDVDRTAARATAAGFRKWNTTRLYYYESIDTKWDWSLSTAVAKWNTTGGGIKLVRTTDKSRAKLLISYGQTYGSDGYATIGATTHPWVHLNPGYRTTKATAAERALLVDIFAHELGHVLGFDHVSASCALMTPVIDITGCGIWLPSSAGYYKCQIIDTALVRRFVSIYGGTAKYAPGRCLIDPKPPTLANVTFTQGTTSHLPVKITWSAPAHYPTGSHTVVQVWSGATCGSADSAVTMKTLSATATSWTDSAATTSGPSCFRVGMINQYGVPGSTRSATVDRWITPPTAPTIGSPSWSATHQEFTFPVTLSSGSTLLSQVDLASPSTCTGTYDASFSHDNPYVAGGTGHLYPQAADSCVTFFATKAGLRSAGVTRTFSVPANTETVNPSTVYVHDDAGGFASIVTGTVTAYHLNVALLPGSCPQTVTDSSLFQQPYPGDLAHEYVFYPPDYGSYCAVFASVDDFGRVGPQAGRPLTYDPPAP